MLRLTPFNTRIGKIRCDCIAATSGRFVSLSLGVIRFIDTLQFLNASLETLVGNMHASGADFDLIKHCFEEHVDLFLRKGIYPYHYMTDVDRFDETELPARKHFFKRLCESPVTDEATLTRRTCGRRFEFVRWMNIKIFI